jgi:nitrogenase molybdenum-iron protein alpha/beta subunit
MQANHPDLEKFRLRPVDHTDLFGIFMGVHAIPNTVMLLHTTVGCKFKTQMHLVDHDWFSESHNQRLWTGVDDVRLIQGSGKRLLQFATTWYERRHPELFVVTTNAAIELSAFDVEAAVQELQATLPCPVILLKAPGHEGSYQRGYRRFIEAICELVDWDVKPQEKRVSLVGYLFDRFEMDHAANLSELRRLLLAAGLEPGVNLLEGRKLGVLANVAKSQIIGVLPVAKTMISTFEKLPDRKVVSLDLPIGLNGTAQFLRTLVAAAGGNLDELETVIDREMARAVPLIAHGARRLKGTRVAIFQDTPTAIALAAFLWELDCEVPLVALSETEPVDPQVFFDGIERLGVKFANQPVVLSNASRDGGLAEYRRLVEEDPIPVVIGSSLQKAALGAGQAAVIELGYPSVYKHSLFPVPWLGFNGALALVQRLVDALNYAF